MPNNLFLTGIFGKDEKCWYPNNKNIDEILGKTCIFMCVVNTKKRQLKKLAVHQKKRKKMENKIKINLFIQ